MNAARAAVARACLAASRPPTAARPSRPTPRRTSTAARAARVRRSLFAQCRSRGVVGAFEEESPRLTPYRALGDDRPSPQGYYRWPALHGDVLVFVCEDDLWRCDVTGGVATRITDAPGPVLTPLVSRDGTRVAFTVQQDACQEIYVVSTRGGPVTQVTHAGAERTRAACWSADGTRLFFASSAGQSFVDTEELWCVDVAGGGDDDDGTSRRERIASTIESRSWATTAAGGLTCTASTRPTRWPGRWRFRAVTHQPTVVSHRWESSRSWRPVTPREAITA